MPPEFRVALINQPLTRSGLREIAALLPEDDAELLKWIGEAYHRRETDELIKLLYAAAIAGRKLPASLISDHGLELFQDGWRFGWLAAHMEGDVMAALLPTSADNTSRSVAAFAMYVAARWWTQHRPGEPFPGKLQAAPRAFRSYPGISPDVEAVMGALAVLMKDPVLAPMWGGKGRAADQDREYNFKRIEAFLASPLEQSIPQEENRGYFGSQPVRRAVEKMGRNEPCHCSSGKKYKDCCWKEDQDRLRRSSAVAGKTWDEVEDGDIDTITSERVGGMTLPELAGLYIAGLADEPQQLALLRLAEGQHFEEVVDTFRELGLPDRLRHNWKFAVQQATRAWKRDVVLQLIEAAGDAAPPLENVECCIRILLASHDPAQFCAALEAECLALLKSHDSQGLQYLVAGLTYSPYGALGVMVARGALLLTEPKHSAWIFDEIISKRANLDLPIDDPAADLLDERASRRGSKEEDPHVEEERLKLEAMGEEKRQRQEQLAATERLIALLEKRERRAAAEQTRAAAAPPAESAELREARQKEKTLKARLKEGVEERLNQRREIERLNAQVASYEAAQASAPAPDENDEEEGEPIEVAGNQPVRMIEFPKHFAETLAVCQAPVGRAAMNIIGRLASGEKTAFDGVVAVRASPGVLRKKVASSHRLLFSLEPHRLLILDLIARRDLDRRVDKLKNIGH